MKGEGLAPPSHGQDQPLALVTDGLGGPLHRHVLLGMVGVAMARVAWAQLLDGLDVGEKLLADHLERLAMQGVLCTFVCALQLVSARPTGPLASGLLMTPHTVHPDPGRFHLRGFEAATLPAMQFLRRIGLPLLHYSPPSFLSLSTPSSCPQ